MLLWFIPKVLHLIGKISLQRNLFQRLSLRCMTKIKTQPEKIKKNIIM